MYSFCCKFNWWQIWKLSYLASFIWSESILVSMKSSLISGFFFDDFFLGVSLWKEIGVPAVKDSVSVSISLSSITSVYILFWTKNHVKWMSKNKMFHYNSSSSNNNINNDINNDNGKI